MTPDSLGGGGYRPFLGPNERSTFLTTQCLVEYYKTVPNLVGSSLLERNGTALLIGIPGIKTKHERGLEDLNKYPAVLGVPFWTTEIGKTQNPAPNCSYLRRFWMCLFVRSLWGAQLDGQITYLESPWPFIIPSPQNCPLNETCFSNLGI